MEEPKALYIYSAADAKRLGKLELWRESYKENCKCARAIEDAIRHSFDGMYLQNDTAKSVIRQFGFDRVNWVLANTIQEKSYDGRFSSSNKDWSRTIYIPRSDSNWAFTVESHPAVLDGFVTQARKAWAELGLFDRDHCISEQDEEVDYTGKVLVLRAQCLKDAYKTPDYQLFLAESGFGCSPNARGRKIFGQFLMDGEETYYMRSDFIGVLKDEYLPDWVREKLDAIQGQEQGPVMEQTM